MFILNSTISEITCNDLRVKTFGYPDPFVRLAIGRRQRRRHTNSRSPHQEQCYSSVAQQSTINPSWNELVRVKAVL